MKTAERLRHNAYINTDTSGTKMTWCNVSYSVGCGLKVQTNVLNFKSGDGNFLRTVHCMVKRPSRP